MAKKKPEDLGFDDNNQEDFSQGDGSDFGAGGTDNTQEDQTDMGSEYQGQPSYNPDEVGAENDGDSETLQATTEQIPELEGLQVGDEVSSQVDFTVKKVNEDGSYILQPIDFTSVEQQANENPDNSAPASAPEQGGGAGAGGLASLLGQK